MEFDPHDPEDQLTPRRGTTTHPVRNTARDARAAGERTESSGWQATVRAPAPSTWNPSPGGITSPALNSHPDSHSGATWLPGASPWIPRHIPDSAGWGGNVPSPSPWNSSDATPRVVERTTYAAAPGPSPGFIGAGSTSFTSSPPVAVTHDDPLPAALLSSSSLAGSTKARATSRNSSQRVGSNKDEFDGPHQLLERLNSPARPEPSEADLLVLPTHLDAEEQEHITSRVTACLSHCAFHFVALYQFPIPLEANKRPVRVPEDREWNEWVFLLKRLATKRRVPARVLFQGDIRHLSTVLDNSLEMRQPPLTSTPAPGTPTPPQPSPSSAGGSTSSTATSTPQQERAPPTRLLKDDRQILQIISAGIQVARMLKDAAAMRFLDSLYRESEALILRRRTSTTSSPSTSPYELT